MPPASDLSYCAPTLVCLPSKTPAADSCSCEDCNLLMSTAIYIFAVFTFVMTTIYVNRSSNNRKSLLQFKVMANFCQISNLTSLISIPLPNFLPLWNALGLTLLSHGPLRHLLRPDHLLLHNPLRTCKRANARSQREWRQRLPCTRISRSCYRSERISRSLAHARDDVYDTSRRAINRTRGERMRRVFAG